MQVEFRQSGIYLPEIELWLDNSEPCGATWISHGHGDHARGCHGRVIGTATTLRFYRMRLWLGEAEAEPLAMVLDYGESLDWNGARSCRAARGGSGHFHGVRGALRSMRCSAQHASAATRAWYLMEHEPGHPLLREAVREVLEDECDAPRALQEAAPPTLPRY